MHHSKTERAVARAGQQREAKLGKQAQRSTGTVHTPPVLARHVAQAADRLARTELSLKGGLADHRVALIDPACGPGAFLAAALAVAGQRVGRPRITIGLDRDPAAVAMSRVLLRRPLSRACWDNELAVRDTLHAVEPATVARRADTAIVLGNPPWIASAQPPPSPWLDALLEDYRCDAAGQRLPERKLGVLADAYIRFIRWSAEVVRLAPSGGLLALVTNGSYLDGPVHRAMRAALMRHFDRLHVIDLGGNALLARPGAADGNIFGVRTSVAVLLAVRTPDCDEGEDASVQHHALTGSAQDKLATLERDVDAGADPDGADAASAAAAFAPLTPAPPFHRFVPTAPADAEYNRWPSLAEAMPFHREGIQTNRDAIVIAPTRHALIGRLARFISPDLPADELAQATRALKHYDPERARAAVRRALTEDPDGTRNISARPILYRPFDPRWFAPIPPLCHRPRPALLRAIDHSTNVLVTVRKDRSPAPWLHFATTTLPIDNCLLSARSSCRARAFPTHTPEGAPNLAPQVAAELERRVGRAVSSGDYVHYILATLADPDYRARHQQALQLDYPRIPWPDDAAHFDKRVDSGRELSALFQATTNTLPKGDKSEALTIGHHRVSLSHPSVAALAERIG